MIDDTLKERGARYGNFRHHADIAQGLREIMMFQGSLADAPRPGWNRLASDQQHALLVIADKIARILNGDPNYIDNWHDIQGYAKLVEDRLTSEQK